jgi:hypothetical protein
LGEISPAEQVELERLDAWRKTLPAHLTSSGDPEEDELRRLLAENERPAQHHSYEDPAEHWERLKAKSREVIDVKTTKPVEEPDDEMTAPIWPADVRRPDDDDES